MKILLTGGAGYIGSHTGLLLAERGHLVEMVDNFSTGVRSNVSVLKIPCHEFDIRETDRLADLLRVKNYDIVIHFAGSAYVPESFSSPEKYYQNNVTPFQDSFLFDLRDLRHPGALPYFGRNSSKSDFALWTNQADCRMDVVRLFSSISNSLRRPSVF